MFAGGSVRFHAPLRVGEEARRVERVVSVTQKSGRQGGFTLVEVEVELHAEGRLAISEKQDIVYRAASPPPSDSAPLERGVQPIAPSLLQSEEQAWTFRTDPTKLMRFSSATCNGHRIHYDYPYATQVEGYPGLVVQGPLMTLALAEVLRLQGQARSVQAVAHRNLRPLFCGQSASIKRRTAEDGAAELSLCSRPSAMNSTLSVWESELMAERFEPGG